MKWSLSRSRKVSARCSPTCSSPAPLSPSSTTPSSSQIALRIEAESYAPNELIIKPGDPALFMYTIRRGLAAKAGAVMATGMHFGDDFLLTSYFRPYTVRALTYLDCFRMDRSVLAQMFQYKQFPSFQVCIQW